MESKIPCQLRFVNCYVGISHRTVVLLLMLLSLVTMNRSPEVELFENRWGCRYLLSS